MVLEKYILAVITMHPDAGIAGLPIFYAKDEQEQNRLANLLEAILDGIAHKISDWVYIIVKH